MENSTTDNSAARVLEKLCWLSSFKKPEVKVTRPQIQKELRLSKNTVLDAWRQLKAEGTLVCIKDGGGGKGVAPTYRLIAIGEGAKEAEEKPKRGRDSKAYKERERQLLRHHSFAEARRLCDIEFDIE